MGLTLDRPAPETPGALPALSARAVLFDGARGARLADLELEAPGPDDVVIEVEWSGVSSGTERLLWSGDMPPFPGLAYPLVPGYEAVGRVVHGPETLLGRRVFAPGSKGFKDARGLFGGSASRLVAPAARVTPVDFEDGEEAALLALAATAHRAVAGVAARPPELIVGHGVLGRLCARIVLALGAPAPVVWEVNPDRMAGDGYGVIHPDTDDRRDYAAICDVSGDSGLIDSLVMRLARGGEIVLAGFYAERLGFAFPAAFMKEARFQISAEWGPDDLGAVLALVAAGRLSLAGLVSHRAPASQAADAYAAAFGDPACLKMVLDWRGTTAS